jgi:hypothetical protein
VVHGEKPERKEEQREVEPQREDDAGGLDPGSTEAADDEARGDRRDQEQAAEREQEHQPAQPGAQEVAAVLERHRPDPVKRSLHRLGHAQSAPQ